jgi:hypothetical protein
MEAPKCKICGVRHYGICPTTPEKKPQSMPEQAETRIKPSVPPDKTVFDRKEYQKLYMREYRKRHKLVPR